MIRENSVEAGVQQGSILDAIFSHERTRGDSIAYTLLASDESVAQECTFAEFVQQVREIAQNLRQVAVRGDRAVLMGSFGIDYLQVFLACLHEGVIAVPAYPPRRNRKDVRLEAIVNDCRPAIAICEEKDLGNVSAQFPKIRVATIQSLKAESSTSDPDEISLVDSDSMAYLQYTSGSTAAPKGVMISHGNLLANSRAIQHAFGNTQQSVGVMWLPMFHDMGLVSGLQTLFVGYRNILIPTNSFVTQPAIWLRVISNYRGTVSGGPNFAFQHCIDRIPASDDGDNFDLSSWQVAYNGAEPIRSSTLDQFVERFQKNGFRRVTFLPCYGLAESTLFVTGGPHQTEASRHSVDRQSLELGQTVTASQNPDGSVELISSGRPDPDAELRIVDPITRTCLNERQVGEIWVRSSSIAQGYWEDAESTQEDFHAQIESHSGGVYLRTGDIGLLHNGELYVTGRHKDLIIVNGRNVYPHDIESEFELQLTSAVPNGAAAFGIEQNGQEAVVIVAEASRQLYRDARNGQLDGLAGEIDEFRQSIWNSMNLHIWEISFIRPGTFPRTSSGKIQRSTCRDSFLDARLEVIVRSGFKADPKVVPSDSQEEQRP